MGGYFKIWRELFDKPIWIKSTPEQCLILLTILREVNWKESEWEWQGKKFKVMPGQWVTSLDSIIKACHGRVTQQNVRSALARFEKLEFLTNESTKCGRLITIVNWELYQGQTDEPNKDVNKEVTKTQQRGNKEVTTKEEVLRSLRRKEVEEGTHTDDSPSDESPLTRTPESNPSPKPRRKRKSPPISENPPTFNEWEAYCKEQGFGNIAQRSYQGYKEANWHDSRGNPIYNWKQKLIQTWFKEDNRDRRESQGFDVEAFKESMRRKKDVEVD